MTHLKSKFPMASKNKKDTSSKTIAQNRRARFDYEILETIEAGIILMGSEVKSLRLHGCSLNESYAGEKEGEIYLFNVNIPEYTKAGTFNHEPKRPRKLLIRRKQINKMLGAVRTKGMTLIALSLYFNDRGLVKVNLGLAKGKKTVDKRETIKAREWGRQKARLLKGQ